MFGNLRGGRSNLVFRAAEVEITFFDNRSIAGPHRREAFFNCAWPRATFRFGDAKLCLVPGHRRFQAWRSDS
jgi:hypothetical protein